MKGKWIKYIAVLAALFLVVTLLRGCCDALLVSYREVYTSPQGTNTIIVEYDHVCRPYVYKKERFWKKYLWTYPGGGFMETVFFGVEWLSEDKIRMTYDDLNDKYYEQFIIEIP